MMMKKNSSQVSYFTLAAYLDSGDVKFLYFVVLLTVYVLIVGANVFLMVVICMNRSLHEPMYMFLLSLFVNELYGSSGLFPFLLVQILSDLHTVAAPLCFLQIFIVYSYGGVEYLSLAVMSYDRYVAICCPLHYKALMTANRTATLIVLTWLYPLILITVMVCLSSSLQLCGNIINKVYCDNYSVVTLSCSDASVNNIYGLVSTFCTIVLPLILIIFTYVKIFSVCLHSSKQTRQKAVSTCTPHLAVLLNFSFGASFETLQSRFDMSRVPAVLRIFLSLYSVASLPLFNPLMYGFNVSKIRLGALGLISSRFSEGRQKIQALQKLFRAHRVFLSCVDVSLIRSMQLLVAAAVIFLPLLLIFGCYVQILAVSFRLSGSRRPNKALATCVPHLVTYVSLVSSIVFEVVQPALANKNLPHALLVVMSMEGFLLPPLLNPLIYGVNSVSSSAALCCLDQV